MRVGSSGRDDHVPEPEVAVDDGLRHGGRELRRESLPDLVDGGQLAGGVERPELGEPSHLTLEVVPRAREGGEGGLGHVAGVDLGQHVDEILHQPAPRRHVLLEQRRKAIRDHLAVDEVHDVERDAEHRVVLADRPHRGDADARAAAARSAGVPRGRHRARISDTGGRGGRRRTNRSASRSIRKVKFERPSPTTRARSSPDPRPCSSMNARTLSSTRSGGCSSARASALVVDDVG